jgi:hypothetical protein
VQREDRRIDVRERYHERHHALLASLARDVLGRRAEVKEAPRATLAAPSSARRTERSPSRLRTERFHNGGAEVSTGASDGGKAHSSVFL